MAKISNVYCAEAIASCKSQTSHCFSFGEIVGKDSPGKSFGFDSRILNMKCLDLDMIEADARGANDKTMDLAVGVSEYDNCLCEYSSYSLLPIELKLNCVKFNLKEQDLRAKDKHSRDVLKEEIKCSETSVFLFPENLVRQARSFLGRWRRGTGSSRLNKWEFLSARDLNVYIRFSEDYPYCPKTDFDTIDYKIDDLVSKGQIGVCADFINTYVKELAEYYWNRRNVNELSFIIGRLAAKMESIYLQSFADQVEMDYLKLCTDAVLSLGRQ